jgi:hypothetical protein
MLLGLKPSSLALEERNFQKTNREISKSTEHQFCNKAEQKPWSRCDHHQIDHRSRGQEAK